LEEIIIEISFLSAVNNKLTILSGVMYYIEVDRYQQCHQTWSLPVE